MSDFVMPPGRHGNERIVEYNWVLSKLQPNTSILDVGTVAPPIMSGYPEFVFNVTRRLQCRYVTMDIMPGANILGDIREVELAPQSFDTIVCISTLEHVTIRPEKALRNMLNIGKQILITMPFGLWHEMPWGFNYDAQHLHDLLVGGSIEVYGDYIPARKYLREEKYFQHAQEGWRECSASDLKNRAYWSSGSEGASGIVCLELGYDQPEEPAS